MFGTAPEPILLEILEMPPQGNKLIFTHCILSAHIVLEHSSESMFRNKRPKNKNKNDSYSISHIKTRREFLTLNLRLRDETEKNVIQSQASRRDRDLLFSISDFETRTRIEIKTILVRILENLICCLCLD